MAIENNQNNDKQNEKQTNFERREILQGVLASLGVVAVAATMGGVGSAFASPLANGSKISPTFYTKKELQLVERLADLIIPATETLGALAVGVPMMLDKLYTEWASDSSKRKHKTSIKSVSRKLKERSKTDFLSLSAAEQTDILNAFDKDAFEKQGQHIDYIDLKDLIARFYYLSEEGATKELRYERVPGKWESCIPVVEVGRTWAK